MCNTDNIKDYLKTVGWCNSFIDRFRSNKVSPIQNESMVMNERPNTITLTNSTEKTTNSSIKMNVKKLSKTNSDSQILHNSKEKCRKKSV